MFLRSAKVSLRTFQIRAMCPHELIPAASSRFHSRSCYSILVSSRNPSAATQKYDAVYRARPIHLVNSPCRVHRAPRSAPCPARECPIRRDGHIPPIRPVPGSRQSHRPRNAPTRNRITVLIPAAHRALIRRHCERLYHHRPGKRVRPASGIHQPPMRRERPARHRAICANRHRRVVEPLIAAHDGIHTAVHSGRCRPVR
jgi:hypothetical protein